MDIRAKEKIEIDFWKHSETENPDAYSIHNIIAKTGEAAVFLEKLQAYARYWNQSESILEIGGGQGWASCIVKLFFPQKRVVSSDISEFAIRGIHIWEHIYKVKVDKTLSCTSYQVPLNENEFDLIFCYAAAHHFQVHRKTLKELHRLLKPGGAVLYLHEPGCTSYMHKLAKWRVNKKRPEVPEDVLVYKKITALGEEAGFTVKTVFAPSLAKRAPFETIYYYILNNLSFLQRILPCTVDIIFIKN